MNLDHIDLSSLVVTGVDPRDFPDFCDSYIEYAQYNTGRVLTDDELDELNSEFPELAQERAFNALLD